MKFKPRISVVESPKPREHPSLVTMIITVQQAQWLEEKLGHAPLGHSFVMDLYSALHRELKEHDLNVLT